MMKKLSSILAGLLIATGLFSTIAQAEEHIVKVVTDYDTMRMYFDPLNVTIEPGDTVTWVNEQDEDHNMVTFPDGFPKGATGFESPYLTKAGEKWSHTFEKPGTYQYHCIPHLFMGMRGNITVGWASAPEDHHIPSEAEVSAYRDKLLQFFDKDDFEHAPDYVRAKTKAMKAQCDDYCEEKNSKK